MTIFLSVAVAILLWFVIAFIALLSSISGSMWSRGRTHETFAYKVAVFPVTAGAKVLDWIADTVYAIHKRFDKDL